MLSIIRLLKKIFQPSKQSQTSEHRKKGILNFFDQEDHGHSMNQRDERYLVDYCGRYYNDILLRNIYFQVLDISKFGLKIYCLEKLEVDEIYFMKIGFNDTNSSVLFCRVIWQNEEKYYGLKILKNDHNWNEEMERVSTEVLVSNDVIG